MIEPGEQADSLIGRADSALYSAKAAGRDRTFVHHGAGAVSLGDFQHKDRPSGPAARLIELIQSTSGDADSTGTIDVHRYEFGPYLARDADSAQLAQTCEELRRFVDERGQSQQVDPQVTQSQ